MLFRQIDEFVDELKRRKQSQQRKRGRIAANRRRAAALESLEARIVLTSTLYVDFGDVFPDTGLTGTLEDLRTTTSGVPGDPAVRGPVMDGTLNSDWASGNMRDADAFTMLSFNSVYASWGATYDGGVTQLRADIMTFVRRFYEPFDIDVVELTSTAIDVNGRMIAGAASLEDVSSNLGANETLLKNNDAYVLLGQMTVHRTTADTGDFDPGTMFGGYASTADMPDSNDIDNSAIVYLRQNDFGPSRGAGYFGNIIAHEAGHDFGFQHSLTTTPSGDVSPLIPTSEIMSYLGGNGFNFFSRYPMVRGNSNTSDNDDLMAVSPPAPATNVTPYDQWVNTPSLGANTAFNYVTGTGAHDIITITKAGPNALVTVEAFSDAGYTTALVVPGSAGASTVYSYYISLDTPIVVDGGDRNDRFILDGDLGTQILVRGMSGTDELIVEGKGASTAIYVPGLNEENGLDGLPNRQGQITVGATTINFQEFETNSLVTIRDIVGPTRVDLSDLDDQVRLELDGEGFVVLTGMVGGTALAPVRFDGNGGLNLYGLAGNDTLTVSSTNGLLADFPIYFDGGAGFDALSLSQAGGATRSSSRVNVGALPGSGQSLITHDAVTQSVFFQNIEPISDNVPAVNYSISSAPGIASLLDAANAINYTTGVSNGATWGRVTVDNFEPIEFTNKTNLIIDAGAGSDEINLNNPNTPTGLASVTVNGGDPTGSDKLIVNGRDGIQDQYRLAPSATGAGAITRPGTPVQNFTGVEHLRVVLQPHANDAFTVDGTTGNDTFRVISGEIHGEVQIEGEMNQTLGGFHLPSISITGNSNSLIGTFNFNGVGGVDTFTLTGTNLNDRFNLQRATATSGSIAHQINGVATNFFGMANIANLYVEGLEGDDEFELPGNFPATLHINGGGPTASDLLIFNGAGDDVAADLFNQTITETGFNPVNYTGIETIQLNAAAANLDVLGTALDDRFTYTPTSATGGTLTADGVATVLQFSGVDAASSFTVQGGAGDLGDTLVLQGTNNHDLLTINSAARVASVTNAGGTLLREVTLAGDVEIIEALGRLGNDTFLVIPASGIPGGTPVGPGFVLPSNLLIFVDGGQPGASDALVVASAGGAALPADRFVVVNRGRNPGEGVVRVFQDQPGANNEPFQFPDIAYTGVELVSPIPFVNAQGVPNLLILGAEEYEANEFLTNAAFLGAGAALNVVNLAVFPNVYEHQFVLADQDYYRVVAQHTGVMDFQVYFNNIPEFLPGAGDLDIQVRDSAGNIITGFGVNDFALSLTGDERRRIPVVAGETYYLQVFGKNNSTVNAYNLSIVNTPTPTPRDLELDDVIATSSITASVNATNFTGAAPLSNVDDFYNGKFLTFTSGPLNGRSAQIVDYVGATRTFVVGAGFAVTPGVGNTFQIESFDTGRSQFDNVTRDATPRIYIRLDDDFLLNDLHGGGTGQLPPDNQVIPIPFQNSAAAATAAGYRVAIFDETNTQAPVFLGFADQVAGQPGVYVFNFTNALTDGSHFITAKVQIVDPSNDNDHDFGAASTSLEIIVDTAAPPVSFGDPVVVGDGLAAESDSGVPGQPDTFSDNITSDTTPKFWGRAEANTLVRLYADVNNNGLFDLGVDLFLGQDVANPLDGTNQELGGYWEIDVMVDLNDPAHFPVIDGLRTIFVTSQDVAGNVSGTAGDVLNVFLDTRGPQIASVHISTDPAFDLFNPKPTQGPTPLVNSLDIDFVDPPVRIAGFVYPAVNEIQATTFGNYVLVGDHVGVIAIESIEFIDETVAGGPGLTTVRLHFFAPLPDDRFTLTVSDNLRDDAGNRLDGESNAAEPQENPEFPTGDSVPGGTFTARFTIDTRPEIAVYAVTSVYVDTNNNFYFDPENSDTTNEDITYVIGLTTDNVFAGNFTNPNNAVADGFAKIAAYGFINGKWRWLIDTDNDGRPNLNIVDAAHQFGGIPVAGNFDGNAANGDEVGLYTAQGWWIDTNHDFQVDTLRSAFVSGGHAIVGDFNGDGQDDLAVWKDDRFYFDLTAGGVARSWNGVTDASFRFGFPGTREKPVAADFNRDGFEDVGLFAPDQSGATPDELAEWYLLISENGQPVYSTHPVLGKVKHDPQLNELVYEFRPEPFGNDYIAQFGDADALPIAGNFDPPVVSQTLAPPKNELHQNPFNPFDVNGDQGTNAFDLLDLVNEVRLNGQRQLDASWTTIVDQYFDIDGDQIVSVFDVLALVNQLRLHGPQAAPNLTFLAPSEGDGEEAPAPAAALATTEDESVEASSAIVADAPFWFVLEEQADAPQTSPQAPLTAEAVETVFAQHESSPMNAYSPSNEVEDALDEIAEGISSLWDEEADEELVVQL